MERQSLYESYQKMTWQQQLGNTASSWASISSNSEEPLHDEIVKLLLREVELTISWSTPNAPPEFIIELNGIQREAQAWLKAFPIDAARHILAIQARNRSNRLLQMAGLLFVEETPIGEILSEEIPIAAT